MSELPEFNAAVVVKDLQQEISTLKLQIKQQDNQSKKEIAILEQRIQLQEMQIIDAKSREDNLRKMNETFISNISATSSENNKCANKSLKGLLEDINLDNEANKLKRLDYITKLEKENRELQDNLHEKTIELGNLSIKLEKQAVNIEIIQQELENCQDAAKKKEKETKELRENYEKEISRRSKEMNILEDTLRRECQNEIERNNAQNEERLQHIKELYQKKEIRNDESDWEDRKCESFMDDMAASQTNPWISSQFQDETKERLSKELQQEKIAKEELELKLQEMQEKFKEFQLKNKSSEQSIQLIKEKFERQKQELQELEQLREKVKTMKEKNKGLKEKIVKIENEADKLREQLTLKNIQLEEERKIQSKIIAAFKDQQLSFIQDTSNVMSDNDQRTQSNIINEIFCKHQINQISQQSNQQKLSQEILSRQPQMSQSLGTINEQRQNQPGIFQDQFKNISSSCNLPAIVRMPQQTNTNRSICTTTATNPSLKDQSNSHNYHLHCAIKGFSNILSSSDSKIQSEDTFTCQNNQVYEQKQSQDLLSQDITNVEAQFGTFAPGNFPNMCNDITSSSCQKQSVISASGHFQSVISRNACEGCSHQIGRYNNNNNNNNINASVQGEREVEELRLEIAELQRIILEYERDLINLQNENNNLISINNNLQSQSANMNIQINNVQTQNIRLQSLNSSLQSELSALQSTNTSLQNLNSTITLQVVDQERIIEEKNKEITNLKENLSKKEKEVVQADELRKNTEDENAKKTENEMVLKSEIKYLVEKLLQAKEQIDQLEKKNILILKEISDNAIKEKEQFITTKNSNGLKESKDDTQYLHEQTNSTAINKAKTNISIIKAQILQKQQQQKQQKQLQQILQEHHSSQQQYIQEQQQQQQNYEDSSSSSFFSANSQHSSSSELLPSSNQLQQFQSNLIPPGSSTLQISPRMNLSNSNQLFYKNKTSNSFSNSINLGIQDYYCYNDGQAKLPTKDNQQVKNKDNLKFSVTENNDNSLGRSIVRSGSSMQARECVSQSLCLNGSTESPGFLNFINQNKENSSFQTKKESTQAEQKSPVRSGTQRFPLQKTRLSLHNISNCNSNIPNRDLLENKKDIRMSNRQNIQQPQQIRQSASLLRSNQQKQSLHLVQQCRSDKKIQSFLQQ